jgi:multiple sugar transport system permease protein
MKYLLIAPALILCAVFFIWPLIAEVRYSTQKTDFITTKNVGLANYKLAFESSSFRRAWLNSLAYMAIMAVGQTVIALFVAFAVCRLPKRWIDATRAILYIPVLSAGIIVAQSWRWIFHADGPLNWIVKAVGMPPIRFFASSLTAIPAISLIVVSSGVGGVLVIFLSYILSIDPALYEAAQLDGASWWQIKIHIILPHLRPAIALTTLLAIIGGLQIFETIFALAPYEHAATVTFHVYRDAFQMGRYGFASAQAILLLVATVLISLVKKRVEKA